MNVIEIGLTRYVDRWSCVAPFVYEYLINPRELAIFWTRTFGCLDETTKESINVLSVSINSTDRLVRYDNFEAVLEHQESFAFDWGRQLLRINYGVAYNPIFDYVDFQYSFGFCDKKPITIDGAWYLPVLKDAPKYTIKEDLVNYKKLAMANCSLKVFNNFGELDFLNELTLFNNDLIHYRIPDSEQDEFTRDDLIPLNNFLIKDVKISMQGGTITGQDIRNSYDTELPLDIFTTADYPALDSDTIGKPIPLCFGQCNIIPAVPVNGAGSGDVYYRAARAMTSFGVAQILVNDVWTTTPILSQDLATGTFLIDDLIARPDGDDPRKCRLLGAIGEPIDRLTDIIPVLEDIANGIPFEEPFYDVTEWEAEAEPITTGGYYLGKKRKLYDIIRDLQDGCSHRFRYEYNKDQQRTIRRDDITREPVFYIQKEEIKENGRLEVETDRDTIFAFTEITWNKDYANDSGQVFRDSSSETNVARNLRQRPTLAIDSYLTFIDDAVSRAQSDAQKYGQVRRFSEFTLTAEKYLSLRIYAMIEVELFTRDRKWMGKWLCQVLSLSPREPEIKIGVCLIERKPFEDEGRILRITDTGDIRAAELDEELLKREVTK